MSVPKSKSVFQTIIEEPFWIGAIILAVILMILGLIGCLKKRYKEELHKCTMLFSSRSSNTAAARKKSVSTTDRVLSRDVLGKRSIKRALSKKFLGGSSFEKSSSPCSSKRGSNISSLVMHMEECPTVRVKLNLDSDERELPISMFHKTAPERKRNTKLRFYSPVEVLNPNSPDKHKTTVTAQVNTINEITPPEERPSTNTDEAVIVHSADQNVSQNPAEEDNHTEHFKFSSSFLKDYLQSSKDEEDNNCGESNYREDSEDIPYSVQSDRHLSSPKTNLYADLPMSQRMHPLSKCRRKSLSNSSTSKLTTESERDYYQDNNHLKRNKTEVNFRYMAEKSQRRRKISVHKLPSEHKSSCESSGCSCPNLGHNPFVTAPHCYPTVFNKPRSCCNMLLGGASPDIPRVHSNRKFINNFRCSRPRLCQRNISMDATSELAYGCHNSEYSTSSSTALNRKSRRNLEDTTSSKLRWTLSSHDSDEESHSSQHNESSPPGTCSFGVSQKGKSSKSKSRQQQQHEISQIETASAVYSIQSADNYRQSSRCRHHKKSKSSQIYHSKLPCPLHMKSATYSCSHANYIPPACNHHPNNFYLPKRNACPCQAAHKSNFTLNDSKHSSPQRTLKKSSRRHSTCTGDTNMSKESSNHIYTNVDQHAQPILMDKRNVRSWINRYHVSQENQVRSNSVDLVDTDALYRRKLLVKSFSDDCQEKNHFGKCDSVESDYSGKKKFERSSNTTHKTMDLLQVPNGLPPIDFDQPPIDYTQVNAEENPIIVYTPETLIYVEDWSHRTKDKLTRGRQDPNNPTSSAPHKMRLPGISRQLSTHELHNHSDNNTPSDSLMTDSHTSSNEVIKICSPSSPIRRGSLQKKARRCSFSSNSSCDSSKKVSNYSMRSPKRLQDSAYQTKESSLESKLPPNTSGQAFSFVLTVPEDQNSSKGSSAPPVYLTPPIYNDHVSNELHQVVEQLNTLEQPHNDDLSNTPVSPNSYVKLLNCHIQTMSRVSEDTETEDLASLVGGRSSGSIIAKKYSSSSSLSAKTRRLARQNSVSSSHSSQSSHFMDQAFTSDVRTKSTPCITCDEQRELGAMHLFNSCQNFQDISPMQLTPCAELDNDFDI